MSKLRWLLAIFLAMAALPGTGAAQVRGAVTGQVVETDSRRPIQGAQVRVAESGLVAVTDAQGRFQLQNVPAGARTLQVSRVGFKPGSAQVTVGATPANVTVSLQTDALGLEELVVVGYGEQRRREVAGAVSSLRPTSDVTVRDAPISSVNEVLQGRLAGVQVFQNSGTPGAAISVRVRGSASLNAGNQPLYVVDGVPMIQGNFSANPQTSFGGQGIDAISDLNPKEIESIEVLKDASAAAIYGSRASNGVVLITTKHGSAGRPDISFGGYYGTQEAWRRLNYLNAEQYTQVYNEGCVNRYGAPCVTLTTQAAAASPVPSSVANTVRAVPGVSTDWLDQVLQTAPTWSLDGSIRGGTERARYYVSGSAVNQDGILRAQGYQRLNGRLNLDYVPTTRLTLGTNVALAQGIMQRARSDNTIYGALPNAMANPPIQPVYTNSGDYYETLYVNPVGMLNESEAEERSLRVLGNTFARYELADWLNIRGSVGLDNLTNRSRAWDSPNFGPWAGSGGAAGSGTYFVSRVTYEGTANFNRAFGSNHDFSGVVGASLEDNTQEQEQVQGTQFPTEFFKYVTSAATIASGTTTRADYNLVSYFGRLSYTFADKLKTTFNLRTDGSSRFGANHRYGTFPSASVLYRLGEEPFMQSQNILANLALRASYGRTGNQQDIGNFASRGLYGGGYNYTDQPGIAPSQLANPDLRWETTDQLNLGTDFSVLNDRVNFTFDYYDKRTKDLLVNRPVPQTTGFATITSNIGAMKNVGYEVSTRVRWLQGSSRGLSWSTDFNLSHNRNEVTELYNNQPISSGFASRVEVGQPIGYFYGYVTEGLFQNTSEICLNSAGGAACAGKHAYQGSSRTAPGDIKFKDLNGDGIINAADRTKIGSPWPDFEGGITNTLSFLGFDATAFVQFSQGNDIFNGNRIYSDRYGSGGDNHTTRALQRWTPQNTNTNEPRAVWGDPNLNTRNSDRFVEDGSYWRLKNAVVGYTIPTRMAQRLSFRSARIYVQGQNLITHTKYSGFDPEVNYAGQSSTTRGTDFYTLPQARTVSFGFNVGY